MTNKLTATKLKTPLISHDVCKRLCDRLTYMVQDENPELENTNNMIIRFYVDHTSEIPTGNSLVEYIKTGLLLTSKELHRPDGLVSNNLRTRLLHTIFEYITFKHTGEATEKEYESFERYMAASLLHSSFDNLSVSEYIDDLYLLEEV